MWILQYPFLQFVEIGHATCSESCIISSGFSAQKVEFIHDFMQYPVTKLQATFAVPWL
jgi:hypothetical protein